MPQKPLLTSAELLAAHAKRGDIDSSYHLMGKGSKPGRSVFDEEELLRLLAEPSEKAHNQ